MQTEFSGGEGHDLKWSYTNGLGEHVERDNPADFLQATDYLCRAFGAIRNKDASMNLENQPGLSYKAKGSGSWKYDAIDQDKESDDEGDFSLSTVVSEIRLEVIS